MSAHVAPLRLYAFVFGTLIALTGVTVWVAFFDLGPLNTVAAMTIAVVKAVLVVLYFMHVRWSSQVTRLFIDAASEQVDNLPKRLADLGVRYPKEREEEFRAQLRELYYKYYGASLSEIDPIQVIREGFQLIYSMNLHLPTRFVLLDKAIATLGSVGIELYEDFNVFEVAKPYARDLVRERFGPRSLARQARRESVRLAGVVAEMPYQVHDVLEELRDGQIEVGFVHKGLDDFMVRLSAALNRLTVALVVTGGLIGSSLIGIFATHGPQLFGVNALSAIGFFLSGLLGIWLLWGVIRSGRL